MFASLFSAMSAKAGTVQKVGRFVVTSLSPVSKKEDQKSLGAYRAVNTYCSVIYAYAVCHHNSSVLC